MSRRSDGPTTPRRQAGLSLVELLVALLVAGVVITAVAEMTSLAGEYRSASARQAELTRDARFAMARMVRAVRRSPALLVPLPDNPGTPWREHVREQTVPPGAPDAGSVLATAVLAVRLDPTEDLDLDGVADADTDGDGRIDEDAGADRYHLNIAGLDGIDDDGDGLVDEHPGADDDEDGSTDEDPVNGLDDDGDGAVDEDPPADANSDGLPGLAGTDDDGDTLIDEGAADDDDEDGSVGEDWVDALAFTLVGGELRLRRPTPPALTPDLAYAYRENHTLAEDVTRLAFTRSETPNGDVLVRIELTLDNGREPPVVLDTMVRVGAGL